MRPPDADLGSRRDPAFIRAHLDELGFFFEHSHRASIEGLEHVPAGRALVVGNHNGGMMSPDWPSLGPRDADDPAAVRRCRDEVRERMQAALGELVREGGHGPLWRR